MDVIGDLTAAIQERRIVRLGYLRQIDGVMSLHYVAPIDLRPGETPKTARTVYLWAYCFDAGQAETHLVDRIRVVSTTEELFKPSDVVARWPTCK